MKIKYIVLSLIVVSLLSGCNLSFNSNTSSDSSISEHSHTFEKDWILDKSYHWHKSTCGHHVTSEKAKHTFKKTVINPTYDIEGYSSYECDVCHYIFVEKSANKLEHSYSSEWSHNESSHWNVCIDKGYEELRASEAAHTFEDEVIAPTYDEKGYTIHTCSVCGYSYNDNSTNQLIREYTITWKNYDGTILEVDYKVKEGTLPIYDGETPIMTNSEEYIYSFSGWSPNIGTVTQNQTYIANFLAKDRKEMLGITPVINTVDNTVTYGLYPCTHVSDPFIISKLDALKKTESNGYYLYNYEYYSKNIAYPFVYSDFKFEDGTMISSGITYWFKCEPIKWKILTSNNGIYSLFSTKILDAHRFDDSSNNYMNSEIRTWLNKKFYDTSFNLEPSFIQATKNNSSDKVYLLSYEDYINTSFFKDKTARKCKATDYALSNNCDKYFNNYYSKYWTRSSSTRESNDDIPFAWFIGEDGSLDDHAPVNNSANGVRPAITIKI